jgi:hypothetical protein
MALWHLWVNQRNAMHVCLDSKQRDVIKPSFQLIRGADSFVCLLIL